MSICEHCGGDHGRNIEEIKAIIIARINTITGAMVDPETEMIHFAVDGEHVASISWPELVEDSIAMAEARVQ